MCRVVADPQPCRDKLEEMERALEGSLAALATWRQDAQNKLLAASTIE